MNKLLVGVALLLLGVLLLQWRSWSPAPPPGADAQTASPAGAEPVASRSDALLEPPPAKEEYASVSERPLFLPDRRPPPDEPEQAEEPEPLTELGGMDLTAVVITPSTVSAWVRPPTGRETVRLRLGDQFEGWTVQTIESDRVVFERQGNIDELILRDYKNAPPPPRPVPPAAQRQPRVQPGPRPGRQPRPVATEDRPSQTATPGADRRPR
jgi:hypothetical protein